MRTCNANVIVYVKQPLREGMASLISEAISSLQGVVRAVNSPRSESLICVDYDPASVDSRHILQVVREHSVPARLVGM
jgi:hypothetical protein